MAAVTAAQRPHPQHPAVNSSAPSPQATAPVLEFRCTYTREAYKKQPKFHDGTISYHTFNKVIVLYDDTRRVVTNHHYRGDEDVEEGVRLSIDRSILVDVAEPAGETQTDLNQVLRQRTSPEKPAPTASRIVRTSTAASQGKPRSLRDVLGASQGPIGRARLPSQTPYEQRQITEASHPDQPPPKRLKVAVGKENLPLKEPPKISSSPPPQRKERQIAARQSWQPGSTQQAVGRVEEVYNLSSDDEAIPPPRLPKQRQQPSKPTAEAQIRPSTSHQPLSSVTTRRPPSPKPPKRAETTRIAPRPDKPKLSNVEAQRTPVTASSKSRSTPRTYTPKPGTSQLQLSTQQPRRKLMLRALISTQGPNAAPPRTRTESQDSHDPEDARDQARNADDAAADRFEESPERHAHQDTANTKETGYATDEELNDEDEDETAKTTQHPTGQQGIIDAPIEIPSSPLFMSQNRSPPPSPSQHIESSQDFEVHMLPKAVEPGESSVHPISLSSKPSPARPSKPSAGSFIDHDDSQGPEPVQSPQKASQAQMPPPPRPAAIPSITSPPPLHALETPRKRTPSKQPFRRVLSENDAHSPISLKPPDSTPFPSLLPDADFPPTAALLRSNNPRRTSPTTKRGAPPAVLRRTLSDPIIIDSNAANTSHLTSFNVHPVAEEPKGEGEVGPWTVDEAWLLFDVGSWPEAVREKAQGGWVGRALREGNVGANTVAAGAGRGQMVTGGAGGLGGSAGGFSSAKGLWYEHTAQGTGVLRDEVGAL